MANLLEKANILITPTAYSDGKIHSAKPIKSLSAEKVVNGDFATDSDWSKGSGWDISGGKANKTGSESSQLIQDIPFSKGKTFKLVFEVSEYTSGNLQINLSGGGGNDQFATLSNFGNGVNTFLVTTTINRQRINFNAFSTPTFSIDNISVKEVIDADLNFTRGSAGTRVNAQGLIENVDTLGSEEVTNGDFATNSDWNLGSGWSIANGVASSDGVSSDSNLNTNNIGYSLGDLVKVSFDISNASNGSLQIFLGATKTYSSIVDGYYEFTTTATRPDGKVFFKSILFNGSISNISVKEVIDVTNIPRINYKDFQYEDSLGSEAVSNGDFSNGTTDWTIEAFSSIEVGDFKGKTSVAKINIGNTGTASRIRQPFNYVNGKTYKVDIEVYVENGNFRADCSDSFVSGDFVSTSTLGSWQTLTANITAISTGSNFIWLRAFDSISEFYIANVSVKEVTKVVTPNSGVGSWLIEPQSTNLVEYSESFGNSYWTKSGSSVVGGFASPSADSPLEAFKLVTSTTNQSNIKTSFTSVVGVYSSSFYIKKQDFNYIYTELGGAYCWFNISDGTVGNSGQYGSDWTYSSHYAIDLGGGWYRCVLVANCLNAGGYNFRPVQQVSGNSSYNTNLSGGYSYIFGAQLEQQSSATSYIPTAGTIISRTADSASKSGISSLINSSEGVLYAEIASLSNTVTSNYISISDGTYDNRISIMYSVGTNIIRAFLRVGGVSQADLSVAVSDITNFHKVAFKFSTNDFSLWIDGVEISTDVSGSTISANTLNRLHFGEISGSTNPFKGNIKAVAVLPILTDEELECLTTR